MQNWSCLRYSFHIQVIYKGAIIYYVKILMCVDVHGAMLTTSMSFNEVDWFYQREPVSTSKTKTYKIRS